MTGTNERGWAGLAARIEARYRRGCGDLGRLVSGPPILPELGNVADHWQSSWRRLTPGHLVEGLSGFEYGGELTQEIYDD